jgi:hypothetical protein
MFASYSHLNNQTFLGLPLTYRKYGEKSSDASREDNVTIGDYN